MVSPEVVRLVNGVVEPTAPVSVTTPPDPPVKVRI